ncbi:hypothetical protein [Phaeospirillum tilakii]|uniref:Alginate export n=1 Tax=Phaeospirillum tilakii TaxID=741673 RepID=A0ABW5C8N9_9PROT
MLVAGVLSSSARAEEALTVTPELTAGIGVFSVSDAGFGQGVGRRDGSGKVRSPNWGEGYLKPGLTVRLDRPGLGAVYGAVSVVGSTTQGEGDAIAPNQLTHGGVSHADLERAMVGWKSGDLLGQTDAIDLSFGRQDFLMGDGFLLNDGNLDQGREGASWFGPRSAWAGSAIGRFSWDPLHADLFWLKSDPDTGGMSIAGVNVEARFGERGTIGAALLRLGHDNPTGSGRLGSDGVSSLREGMRVVDLRARGTPLAALPDLTLAAEGVIERNDGTGRRLAAEGWYAEAGWSFSALPWRPVLTYRYAHFSGDDPASRDRSENFDPLRYGMVRGWGSYYHGEVAGQYYLFNSNENLHMVQLAAGPREDLRVGAIWYALALDRAAACESRDFGREIDLYADWTAAPWLTLSGVWGLLAPEAYARRHYGDDPTLVTELIATLRF